MSDTRFDEHGEWVGPLDSPPFWLNPAMEVVDPHPPLEKGAFIVACMLALLSLGLSTVQAIGVLANTFGEIGWKLKFRAWNLGGVKIKKSTALNPDGSPRLWWRALGHRKSGDPHTCFYRAYVSLLAYFVEWIARYVPKAPDMGRYGATGARFWAGQEWYSFLCDAGYKGEVTQAHPEESIASYEDIVREIGEYWAQHLLGGLKVDGAWGPLTESRCQEWQAEHSLPETGRLDAATKQVLFA